MGYFVSALTCEHKNTALGEECNYFGKLVGSWNINFIDHNTDRTISGEWHFSWILEGMAIQDVIILPDYEIGTTLRLYNPGTHFWDVVYCYTGNIIRLEARKQDEMIVLTFIGDEKRKWVFTEIGESSFHWQNVTVKDDGWFINTEIWAERA